MADDEYALKSATATWTPIRELMKQLDPTFNWVPVAVAEIIAHENNKDGHCCLMCKERLSKITRRAPDIAVTIVPDADDNRIGFGALICHVCAAEIRYDYEDPVGGEMAFVRISRLIIAVVKERFISPDADTVEVIGASVKVRKETLH